MTERWYDHFHHFHDIPDEPVQLLLTRVLNCADNGVVQQIDGGSGIPGCSGLRLLSLQILENILNEFRVLRSEDFEGLVQLSVGGKDVGQFGGDGGQRCGLRG